MSQARRSRTERRQREQQQRKEIQQRERLAALLPGGSPDRPLAVTSAAVIEPRARSTPCPQCGGELELLAHETDRHQGQALRRVQLRCRACHAPRQLWFTLESPLPS